MEDIYVTEHIKEICKQRGWSYYKLAQESGLPHSSLNYMLKHQHVPTMNNLIKICKGLNIELWQFFYEIAPGNTTKQDELIKIWNTLSNSQKEIALIFMYGLLNKIPPQQEE